MSTINGNLHVAGELTADTFTTPTGSVVNASVSSNAAIARTKLAQEELKKFAIPLDALRVHDAFQTLLPGTAATDDLALVGGTLGTNGPSIQAGDLQSAGATTRYARFLAALPVEYDDGQSVSIRAHAGILDNAADTSATVDFEAYLLNNESGVGSDLIATAATDINSTTFAAKDFTITAGSLNSGDILDIRMAVAVNDGGGASPVTACVGALWLLCDIRG